MRDTVFYVDVSRATLSQSAQSKWLRLMRLSVGLRTMALMSLALTNVVLLAACKELPPDYTTVAVYPSRQQCAVTVNDAEQAMICGEIAAYLRDVMKTGRNRRIIVSAVASDPISKDDRSLEVIAQSIRDIGYTDVRTANFDLK